MQIFQAIILYFLLFIGLYYQIFIVATYLSNRKKIQADTRWDEHRSEWPSVTIVVPVWNEKNTVAKTVSSLLNLDYPPEQLNIVIVDDGSTDTTWDIIQQYKNNPRITLYHKENGGKHTAVNYAIARATTQFIGCLDADSFVDKNTLKKMMCRFDDPETMAVTPAMKIYNPTTVVQMVQSTEYIFGILAKKVMALIGAIHVTPGPFTIFRKSVFDKIGPFRKAHNTEDMEIAFRMQAHHMKIDNMHQASVYTTGPNTVKKLYKQRLRWTYGFIQNIRDYKYLFFNADYGNIGFFTLPIGFILLIGVPFSVGFLIYHTSVSIINKYEEFRAVGFIRPHFEFSIFYISTENARPSYCYCLSFHDSAYY